MRTPSDAPKTFIVRAPRYHITKSNPIRTVTNAADVDNYIKNYVAEHISSMSESAFNQANPRAKFIQLEDNRSDRAQITRDLTDNNITRSVYENEIIRNDGKTATIGYQFVDEDGNINKYIITGSIRPVKGMSGDGSGVSTVSSMILPFNSARRKQISDALNTGRLNSDLASALVKENNEAILNGLMNADFTQYEMYVTDEENPDDHTTVRHLVDSSNEKANLQDLVRAAISDGTISADKLDYYVSLGMQGNQTGYVITIPSKIDKTTETGNRVEDIKQNSRQIFIPDFMNGEAEKVFSQNSQTRAMKELASMEIYNYPVDIPQDGRLNVYNDPSTGKAVYQMEYDSGRVQPLTRDDALRKVNKMLIVEDGIDLANKQFYDEDGNLRKGLRNKDGSLNAQFQQDLNRRVDTYVTSAMSELYPQAWQSFAPIANNVINGDFSSEDYKTKLAKAMDSFVDTDNINLINNQRAIYSNYILSNIGMYDNDAYNID